MQRQCISAVSDCLRHSKIADMVKCTHSRRTTDSQPHLCNEHRLCMAWHGMAMCTGCACQGKTWQDVQCAWHGMAWQAGKQTDSDPRGS